MEVKEAVALAKRHLQDVFADEQISNLGLEEIEYNDSQDMWSITLGFSRPWDSGQGGVAAAIGIPRKREYKIVRFSGKDKKVWSIKNRETVD
jgi:hypothetical protein